MDIFAAYVGFMAGAIFMAVLIVVFLTPTIRDTQTDMVLEYQEDCTVPEFYWQDEHRTFCDKIEVSPLNATSAS